MGTTANQSYPYPAGSDAVDVPGDLQALADAVDSDVAAIDANDWVTTARIDDDAVTTAKINDGAVTDAKLAVPKVDQSVVGNLLTANVATGTDTLGTTAGFTDFFTTSTSSTDYAISGSKSLKTTVSGSTPRVSVGGSTSSGTIPVVPGQVYTFAAWAYSPSDTFALTPRVYWWTSAGNVAASTASTSGTDVTLAASWQQGTVTAVAPANAAFASAMLIRASQSSVSGGEVYYTDQYTFHQGAGGLWAPPGTPIANLGVRANPSDATQVQVWNPGNNTWITV